MRRVQIQFEEEQLEALRRLAARRRISIAALVREAVEAQLDREGDDARRRRAVEAIGRFRSGRSDVSAEHDEHLADTLP